MKNQKCHSRQFIAICFVKNRILVTTSILLKIINALIPSLSVIVVAYFIDGVVLSYAGNNTDLFLRLIYLSAFIAFKWLASAGYTVVKDLTSVKLVESIDYDILEKLSQTSYENLEKPSARDLLERLGKKPAQEVVKAFYNQLDFIEYFIKIGALLLIIVVKVWWAPILITLIAVPVFRTAIISGKQDYEAYSESKKHLRKAEYLSELLNAKPASKERTLFGYFDKINRMWKTEFDNARIINNSVTKKNFKKMYLSSSMTMFMVAMIALILLIPVQKQSISTGVYIGFVSAALTLVKEMTWKLAMVIRNHTKYNQYLADYKNLDVLATDYQKKNEGELVNKTIESVELKDVTFTYPETDRTILSSINFRLEKGKTYALVGANGAGKTTLTKLLCGLHHNYMGEITINEQSIASLSKQVLEQNITTVQQQFAKYSLTIREYLTLECDHECSESELYVVLDQVELRSFVEGLPNQLDTSLGKIKAEGTDLSGGQWQKLAIAKSVLSNKTIIILDEPTASIDPISEATIYEQFSKMINKDSIVLLITHRMGAARLADELLVLDNQRIVEAGTHEELLALNGFYASMFNTQRSWYHA